MGYDEPLSAFTKSRHRPLRSSGELSWTFTIAFGQRHLIVDAA
ncbi:hypothetical protein [Streptomyces sp. NPDC012508]